MVTEVFICRGRNKNLLEDIEAVKGAGFNVAVRKICMDENQ